MHYHNKFWKSKFEFIISRILLFLSLFSPFTHSDSVQSKRASIPLLSSIFGHHQVLLNAREFIFCLTWRWLYAIICYFYCKKNYYYIMIKQVISKYSTRKKTKATKKIQIKLQARVFSFFNLNCIICSFIFILLCIVLLFFDYFLGNKIIILIIRNYNFALWQQRYNIDYLGRL